MDAPRGEIEIVFPIPDGPVGEAVIAKASSGRAALKFFLGPPERRSKLFRRALRRDRVIAAVRGTEVLGFVAFKLDKKGPYGATLRDFQEEYGRVGGLGRFLVFSFAEYRERSRNLYLHGIVVDPGARRQGAGSALVEALVRQAERAGCPAVEVEVAAQNDGALRMYANKGFVAVHVTHLGPLRRFFPFAALVKLVRPVAQPAVQPRSAPARRLSHS